MRFEYAVAAQTTPVCVRASKTGFSVTFICGTAQSVADAYAYLQKRGYEKIAIRNDGCIDFDEKTNVDLSIISASRDDDV